MMVKAHLQIKPRSVLPPLLTEDCVSPGNRLRNTTEQDILLAIETTCFIPAIFLWLRQTGIVTRVGGMFLPDETF